MFWQAYRNHHLYVLERWLTKYQALHPRGPILGYCAGHPVFPRSCVHTLHTAERWLREGCKVKSEETPVKVENHSITYVLSICVRSLLTIGLYSQIICRL